MKLSKLVIVAVAATLGSASAWAGEIKGEQDIKANANMQIQGTGAKNQQEMAIGSVKGKGVISGKQKINTTGNLQVQGAGAGNKQAMEIGTVK